MNLNRRNFLKYSLRGFVAASLGKGYYNTTGDQVEPVRGLARNSEKVKSIQDNMFDKTLFTQTIFPGKRASGFAFFKIADNKIDMSNADNTQEWLIAPPLIAEFHR